MIRPRSYSAEPRRGFPANAQGLLFAPVLWFIWFVVIYSVQGAGCVIGLSPLTLRVTLAILTVIVEAAIAVVGVWSFAEWKRVRRRANDAGGSPLDQSKFLSYAALLHSGLFFVAVLWTGIPIVMAEVCNA